ncbi:hypothetical protein BDA99DRAFT_492305 [Phascolomyces articulosus]|uniref:Carrier domain-containing protein n=1 Tax=Phascolomyces articulosus TaxID=60185 RepID=A0AAD5KBZ3_9FUNG|nr:hypothetical protein BDA99DRAFT_492305 [Phascolomyces articulosus]
MSNDPTETTKTTPDFETLTFNQVDMISTHFAQTLGPELKMLEKINKDQNDGIMVVAYMMDDPVLSYLTLLAILKLKYVVFPISPRNSEPAIVHLLTKTNTICLITSDKYTKTAHKCFIQYQQSQQEDSNNNNNDNDNDTPFNSSAKGVKVVKKFIKEQVLLETCLLSHKKKENMNFFDDNQYQERSVARTTTKTTIKQQHDEIIMIIHTSGTTTFPKPVYQKNRGLLFPILDLLASHFSNANPSFGGMSNDVVMLTFPLFHLHGIISLFMSVSQGATTIMFHRLPPLPQETLSVIDKYNVTVMIVPPIQLEDLATYIKKKQNHDNKEAKQNRTYFTTLLRRVKYCSYGGASLSIQVGEYLHSIGLNVRNSYGSSETGFIAGPDLSRNNKKWYHIKPAEVLTPYIYWEPLDKKDPTGASQLIFASNYPALGCNVSKQDDGSYATGDLYIEDPPKSNTWYHIGRMDDTLVMKNGEKTNPIPMENEIRKTDIVRNCMVIGENRECTAVLVELAMDEITKYSPIEMINEVYKSVKLANAIAPNHSIIMIPKMVYILPLNRSLPATFKGSVIRKKAIQSYQKEIEQMYTTFLQGSIINNKTNNGNISSAIVVGTEENKHKRLSSTALSFSFSGQSIASSSSSTEITVPIVLDETAVITSTENNVQQFLCHTAAQVLQCQPKDIDPSVSLFDYGLNSLLAIQLRNKIAARFNNILSSMVTNFCFEYPTINSMVQVLNEECNRDNVLHPTNRRTSFFPVTSTVTCNGIENSHSTKETIEQEESKLFSKENKKQHEEKRYQETQSILHDYFVRIESDFPIKSKATVTHHSHTHIKKEKQKHTVMLTGASGFLGSFLLKAMIQSPHIENIYCIIRNTDGDDDTKKKNQDEWKERFIKSFHQRHGDNNKIDMHRFLFNNKKVILLHLNLNHPKLGLDDTTYIQLQSKVTIIQCCGWLMDFYQTVRHFERECIYGLYNLMKFAYRNAVDPPIQVHVISSVSATALLAQFLQRPKDFVYVVPECPSLQDPHVSMSMGYAQSKYIVEHLLVYLAEHKNMPCFIERLGQLCGDTSYGIWDINEKYPMVMQAGLAMKMMPDLTPLLSTIDWIPADEAAKTILEIMLYHSNKNIIQTAKGQRRLTHLQKWTRKRRDRKHFHDDHDNYTDYNIWKFLLRWKKANKRSSHKKKENREEKKIPREWINTTLTGAATVYHIVNPNQATWSDVLNAMAGSGITFDVVKPKEWINELRKHQDYPAYKLLPYFEEHWLSIKEVQKDNDMKKNRMILWDTEKTVRIVPSLANATVFNAHLFKKCIASWQSA